MNFDHRIKVSVSDVQRALTKHSIDFQLKPSISLDIEKILDVCVDSRQAKRGSLFIALNGTHVDGHSFLEDISRQQCEVAIVERELENSSQLSQIVVPSTREAWSAISRHFFKYPDLNVHLVGVTGTNGKTSCVWMIREILEHAGIKTASMGTLGYLCEKTAYETAHTTPDPPILFAMMKHAVECGAKVFAMEVSSHSIAQKKIAGLRFQSLAFTSFSQDHLDFHLTLENYFETKLQLFREYAALECCLFITNQVLSYKNPALPGQQIVGRSASQFYPTSIRQTLGRPLVIHMQTPDGPLVDFELPFFGEIFVDNFACSLAIARTIFKANGLLTQQVLGGLQMRPVPGRMELVSSTKFGRPTVLVDYAHTPDALEATISTAKALTRGKLTTIFGCGGDRDRGKRPKMGSIASKLSDITVVTDDNPRTESSELIIADILQGIVDRDSTLVIPDRGHAIRSSINKSRTGDVVLIAGKGHEDYQIIGSTKEHFSDAESALKELERIRVFLVVGAGVSGLAACRFLASQGDRVVLVDEKPISSADYSFSSEIVFCKSSDFNFDQFLIDGVIKSPGVSPEHRILLESKNRGLPIISEVDLGLDRYSSPIVAVTGTNGKSTTTSMVSHILNSQGVPATACGNIGRPPSEIRAEPAPEKKAILVCELSSYQLEDSTCLNPLITIFTSFSPDHLERHRTLENYFKAKWKAALALPNNGLLVLTSTVADFAQKNGYKWPNTKTFVVDDQSQTTGDFSTAYPLIRHDSQDLFVEGELWPAKVLSKLSIADRLNAIMAALATNFLTGKSYTDCLSCLENFVFLDHRNQVLGRLINGSLIVNDSKSTNLESTLYAVKSVSGPVVLLMGGVGKGESYVNINRFNEKISRFILFGKSAQEIKNDIDEREKVSMHLSFYTALDEAFSLAKKERVTLLLSPACASFDEFRNFEHRGQVFADYFQKELDHGKIC